MAELDFVLEMSALDEPDKWNFIRANKATGETSKALAGWIDAIAGQLLTDYLAYTGITTGLNNVLKWRQRQGSGLKPGFTRGGKAIG